MRRVAPFQPDDLAELDELLLRAETVVAMEDVQDGNDRPGMIAMRHDVDHDLNAAVKLARWEAERGYRATYFILHTAPYWQLKEQLRPSLELIAELGHEIGIHTNALAVALATGADPGEVLEAAIAELRSYGHPVRGVVGHGDPLCHTARFVNDEQFVECARPSFGEPGRELQAGDVRVQLAPRPLADFGLDYCAIHLRRGFMLSDSGGRWSTPFDDAAAGFPYGGQLHILQHPCWWAEALPG